MDDLRDDAEQIVLETERRLVEELGLEHREAAHAFIGCGLSLLEEACCSKSLRDELAIVTSAIERLLSGGGDVN